MMAMTTSNSISVKPGDRQEDNRNRGRDLIIGSSLRKDRDADVRRHPDGQTAADPEGKTTRQPQGYRTQSAPGLSRWYSGATSGLITGVRQLMVIARREQPASRATSVVRSQGSTHAP